MPQLPDWVLRMGWIKNTPESVKPELTYDTLVLVEKYLPNHVKALTISVGRHHPTTREWSVQHIPNGDANSISREDYEIWAWMPLPKPFGEKL